MIFKSFVTQRTITLHVGENADLLDTIKVFNECCNQFMTLGFEERTSSKRKLQLHYPAMRKRFPRLQSSLVQGARDCAADMLKREKCKKLPLKRTLSAIRYNLRTFTPKMLKNELSISTLNGRKTITVSIPAHFEQYRGLRIASMRIRATRSERIVLELIGELPDVPKKEVSTCIGIDRGINNIIVTSDAQFFNSKKLRRIRGRYAHNRSSLQSVGTRSAKRHLRRLRGREQRFQTDTNHCISKSIASRCLAVAVENLTGIREGCTTKWNKWHNRRLNSWAFAQLEQFLDYKLAANGGALIVTGAPYTSQMCSGCHCFGERIGNRFKCRNCGLDLHADLNAARNIAQQGNALLMQAAVNRPIVTSYDGQHACSPEFSCKPPVLTGGD